MIASTSTSTTAREPSPMAPALRGHAAHLAGRGPHPRDPLGDLASGLPGEAAVLWLGPIEPALTAALESRGCRLLVAPAEAASGPIDLADLDGLEFGRARFDLAVARDVLSRVREPGRLLDALRRALRPGGQLAVTVPNAGHPSVIEALARGFDPYGPGSPLDREQARLFTRESLASAIEDADFVVGRMAAEEGGSGVVAWTAFAYPLPVPGLELIQARAREDAFARDEAEREARQLRLMLEDASRAVDSARVSAASRDARIKITREALDEAQSALRERDAEFLATTRDLLSRLEEVEPLRRERDAAHRHALAAEARCRALELRAEHVLMEYPRRLARKVRSALRRS